MAIGRTIFVVSAPMALIAVFVWGASNKHHKVRSAPPDSTTSEPNKTHHDVGSANRGLTRRPLRRGTDPLNSSPPQWGQADTMDTTSQPAHEHADHTECQDNRRSQSRPGHSE